MITDQPSSTVMPKEQAGATRAVRVVVGISLFIHVLLHALPGMVATGATHSQLSIWTWSAMWTFSSVCMVGAAYGLWGWAWFTRRWRALLKMGGVASLILLLASGSGYAWFGIFFTLAFIGIACFAVDSEPDLAARKHESFWSILVRGIAGLFLIYSGAVIALRPWQQNWGATSAEMARVFDEDKASDSRDHYMNHVVTVKAPPEKVWPYIVQMGQDRAGFYSYDWLERAAGADIRNIKRIVPELQTLKEGDVIRLTQRDYLFGLVDEGVALRVVRLVPNRLLQLDQWGTFWMEPLPGGGCRLGVHTAVRDVRLWAAPINVFVFEPSHWIMQQKMLRTIRDLAQQ